MIEIDTLSTRFKEQDENEEMKSTSKFTLTTDNRNTWISSFEDDICFPFRAFLNVVNSIQDRIAIHLNTVRHLSKFIK